MAEGCDPNPIRLPRATQMTETLCVNNHVQRMRDQTVAKPRHCYTPLQLLSDTERLCRCSKSCIHNDCRAPSIAWPDAYKTVCLSPGVPPRCRKVSGPQLEQASSSLKRQSSIWNFPPRIGPCAVLPISRVDATSRAGGVLTSSPLTSVSVYIVQPAARSPTAYGSLRHLFQVSTTRRRHGPDPRGEPRMNARQSVLHHAPQPL